MDELQIDTSDLKHLAATLQVASRNTVAEARSVVAKGANNVQKDARERIGRGPYLPAYARSITYDLSWPIGAVKAVIGPDKDRPQGPLGNVLEYGSPGRAPRPHLGPALEAESPRFEKALEDVVGKVLGW